MSQEILDKFILLGIRGYPVVVRAIGDCPELNFASSGALINILASG